MVEFHFLSAMHATEQNEVISSVFWIGSKSMFVSVRSTLEIVIASARLLQSSLTE